jgi:YggT family protein
MTYDPNGDRVTVERTSAPVDPPVVENRVVTTASPLDTIRRLVWLLFGILQALIVLRIVLLLLNANEGNDIVSFIVSVTDPFVEPFRGMFRLDQVNGASGSVLDVAAIIALVAWTLIEALVLGIVSLADRRSTVA